MNMATQLPVAQLQRPGAWRPLLFDTYQTYRAATLLFFIYIESNYESDQIVPNKAFTEVGSTWEQVQVSNYSLIV